MQLHQKKRIEVIIEKMAARRAARVLAEAGAKGYTIVPALEGAGTNNKWRRDSDISGSRDMVLVIAITDEAIATRALQNLYELLGEQIGVVSIGTVDVLRPDLF